VGQWVSGSVGQWVSRSVGQWVSESVGQWVSGKMKERRVEGWKMREIVNCQLAIGNCETRGTT